MTRPGEQPDDRASEDAESDDAVPGDAAPAAAVPGVGLDLLEIDRLERALARRPRLSERLFTDGERAYAAAHARPGQHLAARFCAKEAVAKALGLPSLPWREVEVISPPRGGAPQVVLHGGTAARARALGVGAVRLSLTHTRAQAGAIAIIQLGASPPTTPQRHSWGASPPTTPRGDGVRAMTLLPAWLTPLPDASEQRAIDAWAIEERGVPSLELMESAGGALAELVQARGPSGRVAIVCGRGNNGGDGLVAARWLRGRGREVDVLLLAPGEELTGDARANLERLEGEEPRLFTSEALTGAAVVVDAIFGTGFSPRSGHSAGEPGDRAAGAIAAINRAAQQSRPPLVIACDVPSGVDASTGEAAQGAVSAQLTITFSAAKPGLWIAPGKAHAGEVTVAEIGIPSGAPVEPEIGLIEAQVVDRIPRREANSTKFAAGAVLVCGGSTGLTGAPSLACEAAQRAGAGYVTALVPGSLNLVFEQRLLEAMSLPLPDQDGALTVKGLGMVLERTERADALVLGPGIGRDSGTQKLVRRIARRAELPLLLDADGLNAVAGRLDLIAERPAATVLTPHAGELGRLLECPSAEIDARRLAFAREAAERSRAVIVLKGDDTLVAEPEGRVAVSRGGASALATAGTGDVLSGVIGAYLSKRMDPFEAACAGVLVHARAGVLAAETVATEGVIARDVIELLPHARASALRS